MLYHFFPTLFPQAANWCVLACFVLSFVLTIFLLNRMQNLLPQDGGRKFAVNGSLSQGKPRGAGIIFIFVFVFVTCIFLPLDKELLIYLAMLVAAMFTGYLDDRAETPWGELKKGMLDFVIALVCAVTYVYFNGSTLHISLTGADVTLPPILFVILAIILIWASINVVNCTDGVDGLSGTLSLISLLSFYLVYSQLLADTRYSQIILAFVLCIMGYLWYNASPSKLLMGDAGSRSIGLFLAILSLKSRSPLLFLPFCVVFIFDGGLGLLKVSLLRFLKIHILKNVRTPLHDHARKNKHWSDTQTVFRFVILQTVASAVFLYLLLAL